MIAGCPDPLELHPAVFLQLLLLFCVDHDRKRKQEKKMSNQYQKLYRSRENRMLGGVCGGVGEYFDIDPTLVRVLFVFGAFLGIPGALLLIYLVMLIFVPQKPELVAEIQAA
jgi:phage shock protein C